MMPRIFHWALLLVFSVISLILISLGGYLVYLGGSFYYFAAGLTLLFTTFYMFKGNTKAYKIFAALIAVTLVC